LQLLQNAKRKVYKKLYFEILAENNFLSIALETRKIDAWHLHEDYIVLLKCKKQAFYQEYMSNVASSFEEDRQLIADLFTEVIVLTRNCMSF
jgi:N utilization substance protein B